ncbi:MAG: hypothetical protein RIT45_4181 [Pseudomonadota bacterium]|jgi:endonuclease/exonuclease/phosphatase family metal-dependent hydrolase
MRRGCVGVLILLLGWSAVGCEPLWDPQDWEREPVSRFKASNYEAPGDPGQPSQLRAMAWNIKYGAARIPFWFDCWGDRIAMDRAEVIANLEAIAEVIDEMQVDVLLLEEIEVNSRRSGYVDMVQWLLDHTRLNEGAYFETWDAAYVPSEGLGRMNLGNAILSRYPIAMAERIRQVDRTDLDPVTEAFYIKRAIGRVEVQLGARRAAVLVVHTEAYDNDGTKQKQIAQIHEVATAETIPVLLGGDFNELPPSAVRKSGFPDERETAVCSADFAQPPYTPEVMQPFYDDMKPWIPLTRYGADEAAQARYFTHSVLGPDEVNEHGEPGDWNRTLDYLFIDNGSNWVEGSTDVLQRAGQKVGEAPANGTDDRHTLVANPLTLSDHAPVFGVWEVP